MLASINQQIFLFLNSFAGVSDVFDEIILFLANGAGLALVVMVVLVVFFRELGWRALRANVLIFIPAITTAVYAKILKHLFFEARPFLVLDTTKLMFEHGGYDSFPSAHSAIYFALAVSTYLYSRKLGVIVLVFALLIGTSRVVAGVHWPSDILAGFLVGGLASYATHFFVKKLFAKIK